MNLVAEMQMGGETSLWTQGGKERAGQTREHHGHMHATTRVKETASGKLPHSTGVSVLLLGMMGWDGTEAGPKGQICT